MYFFTSNAYTQSDMAKSTDSLINNRDSTKVLIKDTTKFVQSDIKDIINYSSSDSVIFLLETNKMYLYNDAMVD